MREQRKEGWGKKKKVYTCVACGRTLAFCWSCACGFMMCTDCMQENLWGMTCNNITWTCPDCGAVARPPIAVEGMLDRACLPGHRQAIQRKKSGFSGQSPGQAGGGE